MNANEKGSWVKIPRGPAAVKEEFYQMSLEIREG